MSSAVCCSGLLFPDSADSATAASFPGSCCPESSLKANCPAQIRSDWPGASVWSSNRDRFPALRSDLLVTS